MSETRTIESVAFIIGYFILSVILSILNGYALSVWLGINVGLAVIPFILIQLLYTRLRKREFVFDWISIILFMVFIFFLPNTFYLITDVMHINSDDYYHLIEFGNADYRDYIEPYFLMVHVVVSVIVGVYFGVKSLYITEQIIAKKIEDYYTRNVLLIAIILLSSIGIYIGRFLRFFSWEVLNPVKVIPEVLGSVDLFMFTFVITFTVTQYLLYFAYKLAFEKEPFIR